MVSGWIREQNALIFLFSLNDLKSFQLLDKYLKIYHNKYSSTQKIKNQLFIVGNKSDLLKTVN